MTKITIDRAVLEQMVERIKAAQNNLAPRRPEGSADPESSEYEHGAFMWDYYEAALTTCRAALAQPPHTSPDPNGAYESRCAIDGHPHDKLSFLTGYEQGSYDEAMRQGPPVDQPIDPNPATIVELAKLHGTRYVNRHFPGKASYGFMSEGLIAFAGAVAALDAKP